MDKRVTEILNNSGIFQFGAVDTGGINFYDDVRKMCEENICGSYGSTWACPPAVGSVDECRERCRKYEKMLVFSGKYELEDSFDYDGMMLAKEDFAKISGELNDALAPLFSRSLMLSNEGCTLCESCTYPDEPCRYPGRSHGAIEGYGIFVSELAKQAGMSYNNGPDTVTYFAGLLFDN